jgi:hypothetical protein
MHCKICERENHPLKNNQTSIHYHYCKHCDLISKDDALYLPKELEKKRYDTHNNSDESYQKYFTRLINDFIKPLDIQTILDFGSGPYPMLYHLLKDQYNLNHYDPIYHNDLRYQDQKYDLIVLSEVLEHMYNPRVELTRLIGLLHKNGYLLIQTQFRTMSVEDFFSWWYTRDETHVSFYNMKTFEVIKDIFHLEIIKTNQKDIILLKKLGD